MRERTIAPGIAGLAFGVLTFVGMIVASPPRGDYSVSDVADYVASRHRTAVIVPVYLVLAGAFGLIWLVAAMRPQSRRTSRTSSRRRVTS